jgi:hypothetical protein
VPQKIAFLRRCGGNLLAAIPITKALSPASTRSIRIIAKIAQIASMDMKSIESFLFTVFGLAKDPFPSCTGHLNAVLTIHKTHKDELATPQVF